MDRNPKLRRVSGLDILANIGPAGMHERPYLADADTWSDWAGKETASLWQVVALHSKLEPDSIGVDEAAAFDNMKMYEGTTTADVGIEDVLPSYLLNLRRACAAAESGALPVISKSADIRSSVVSLKAFQAWALDESLPVLIDGHGWLPRVKGESTVGEPKRYPWGDYDTPILRAAFAVIEAKWRYVEDGGAFDRERPQTAPTKDEVIAWLMENTSREDVSATKCEEIAGLIRHPLAPEGRRSKDRG